VEDRKRLCRALKIFFGKAKSIPSRLLKKFLRVS
jgi:hypothetical protein